MEESIEIEVRSDAGTDRRVGKPNRAIRALSIRDIPVAEEMEEYTLPALHNTYSEEILRTRLNRKNAAILTYRRDEKVQERVHRAIRICRRGNFHYLLVDEVSLNERPSQQEVAQYLEMYKKLAVIVDLESSDEAYRPWIYKELSITNSVVETNVTLPTHLFSKKPRVRPTAGTVLQSACINWQYNKIPILVFWVLGTAATVSVYFLLNLSLLVSAIVSFVAVMLLVPLVLQPMGRRLWMEIEQRRGVRLTYRQSKERAITKLLEDDIVSDPWELLVHIPELVQYAPVLLKAYPPREFRARWRGSPTFRRLILSKEEIKTVRISDAGWSANNYKNVRRALELTSNFQERTGIPVHVFVDQAKRAITFHTFGATTGLTFINKRASATYPSHNEEFLNEYIQKLESAGLTL